MDIRALLVSRIQFAFTKSFHIGVAFIDEFKTLMLAMLAVNSLVLFLHKFSSAN